MSRLATTLNGSIFKTVALAAWLVASGTAGAAIFTWNGGGSVGSWSTAANWGGTVPTNSPTTDLTFAGTQQPVNSNDISSPFLLRNITFNSGSGAFSLGGLPLTVFGIVENKSATVQTINNKITLGANSEWKSTSGDIVYAGNLGPTNAFTFKKSGVFALALTGTNAIRLADNGIGGKSTVFISGGATTNLGSGSIFSTTGPNALVITNGADFFMPVATTINSGINTVKITGMGSVWNGGANPSLSLDTDSRLTVTQGGAMTNMGTITISNKSRSRVVVSDGGRITANALSLVGGTLNSIWVGGKDSSGNPARLVLSAGGIDNKTYTCLSNSVIVTTDGILSASGPISLGYAWSTVAKGFNTLTVINGGYTSSAGTHTFGQAGTYHNVAWVGGVNPSTGVPSTWNLNGGILRLGWNETASSNNALVVANGGIVTNATVYLGDYVNNAANGLPMFSNLTVTNGATFYGTVLVGQNSSSNNAAIVGGGATLNGRGTSVVVGQHKKARGNSLCVDGLGVPGGAVITNSPSLSLGYGQSGVGQWTFGNRAVIRGGGRVYSSTEGNIGILYSYGGQFSSENRLTVTGAGSAWDLHGGTLRIGHADYASTYATNNALRVEDGGTVTNVGATYVGYARSGAVSVSNRLELAGGHLSATSLQIYTRNILAPQIGTSGIVSATISGTATFENDSLVSPSAQRNAPTGTFTVLTANSVVDNGLDLDPAVDSARWHLIVETTAIKLRYTSSSTVIIVR